MSDTAASPDEDLARGYDGEPLHRIERKLNHIMTTLDDLNAAVAALQEKETAVNTAVTDLLAEVANLTAAVAANGVTDDAIEAAVANINGVVANLSSLAASDPGTQPTDDTPPPDTDTVADDPGTDLPLYTYVGTDPVDSSVWTLVSDVQGQGGESLYTYSGDTAGGEPTGASTEWVPFTGTPVAVSTS